FSNFLNLQISLLGDYQADNAGLALAAIELLGKKGFQLPEEALRKGLAATTWPGRLEIVRHTPLVLLDGAHNLEAFKGLQRNIRSFSYKRLILVIGLLDDKAAELILQEIIPVSDLVIITTPNSPRAADPHVLHSITSKLTSVPIFVQEKIPDAIELALSLAEEKDLVLISGSLYLISDARLLLL
ncbi:MAG: glutamate ligase domain-containing protein, partial [Dethiobacteria bacterium]